MKTTMNKVSGKWMMAVFPVAMLLAVACGMPEDEGEQGDAVGDDLGAAEEYGKAKPGTTVSPTHKLLFTDVKISGQVPANKSSFPIGSTVDVFVAVDYTNVTGAHAQSVRIFAPDGSFYQKFDRQICVSGRCTGDKPEVIGSVAQYWETLPVAGTYITQYNLSGSWRVDLYLDGVSKASATFMLN